MGENRQKHSLVGSPDFHATRLNQKLLFSHLDHPSGIAYNRPPHDRTAVLTKPTSAGAGWQSGYAEDCKSSDVGSIPASASKTRRSRDWLKETKKSLEADFPTLYKASPAPDGDVKTASGREKLKGIQRDTTSLFPGSSVVEQAAVNRLVGGSNPSLGAIS